MPFDLVEEFKMRVDVAVNMLLAASQDAIYLKLSVGSGIEVVPSTATNQNCPFRTSNRPTRRKSDRVAIPE